MRGGGGGGLEFTSWVVSSRSSSRGGKEAHVRKGEPFPSALPLRGGKKGGVEFSKTFRPCYGGRRRGSKKKKNIWNGTDGSICCAGKKSGVLQTSRDRKKKEMLKK